MIRDKYKDLTGEVEVRWDTPELALTSRGFSIQLFGVSPVGILGGTVRWCPGAVGCCEWNLEVFLSRVFKGKWEKTECCLKHRIA